MKETLTFIISSILENPKTLTVEEAQDELGVIHFTVILDKEDMGRVIGKEGKVIRSIRNLMKIPAMKQGKKIDVSLQEA